MSEKYYHTKESVEEYIKLAKDINSRQLILKLDEFLSKNSSLLEIGSGPGTDWNILKENYDVTGSDNSIEFLNRLINNNPESEFLELDAITLKTDKKFDAIYSNKVLHHLKDGELIESITRQINILNSEGIICHSFWKGTGSEIYKGLYVNYHTDLTLRNFFEEYFNILFLEDYKEFEEGDSLVIIGRKK